MKKRKSGFFGFGRRFERKAIAKSSSPLFRKGLIESLERRELLSADWNPTLAELTGDFISSEAKTAAIRQIRALANGQNGTSSFGNYGGGNSGGGLLGEGSNGGGLITVAEVEPNNTRTTAQAIPLGIKPGQSHQVSVTGTNEGIDLDWFSFELRAGDILEVNVSRSFQAPLPPYLSLYDDSSVELASTQGPFPTRAFPENSPLRSGTIDPSVVGSLHYVMPANGKYFLRLGDVESIYTAAFRVYRPPMESQPAGTRQTLFLDFDGEILPRNLFGLGPGTLNLHPLRTFLVDPSRTRENVIALENLIIDEIIARTASKFQAVGISTTNPDYGLIIKNSRDHGDLWGEPNVARVVIGDLLDITGNDPLNALLGIAQHIDVGNFDTRSSAITRILPFGPIAASVPIIASATRAQVLAEVISRTVVHEAGHFFGLWHQDELNSTFGIMDTTADSAQRAGVGPDGVFGTIDDKPDRFVVDRFAGGSAGAFQRSGRNDSINWLGWALTIGQQGGRVEGTTFQDLNSNRSLDNQDLRIPNVLVYADLNNNGIFDASEPSVRSSADGTYSLNLAVGNYTIRSQAPEGYRLVTPNNNSYTTTVALNGRVTGRHFGFELINRSATGRVFNDLNGNRLHEANEPGLAGTWVYIDTDGDCRLDIGEPAVRTGNDGRYTLVSPGAGTFFVRQVLEPGRVQISPFQDPNLPVLDTCTPVGHRVTLSGNPVTDALILSELNFANQVLIDFGDAPASFGSASHGFVNGLTLGTQWDFDPSDQPAPNADGDDLAGIDDEDGIVLGRPLVRGSSDNRINVTTTNSSGQTAFLSAWLDLNRDGNFQANERVITDFAIPSEPADTQTKTRTVTFAIPASAQLGDTFARFRLSRQNGVGSTGFVSSGEVEDYKFTIVGSFTLAVNDTASVRANTALNPIDVLANDFRVGAGDTLTVVATTGVSLAGGSVTIPAGGGNVLYTPPAGFVGTDSFTYTMQNSAGEQGTATVVVDVNLFFDFPIAIDDSFEVPTNAVDFPLNVLANDIEGQSGALSIVSVTQPDKGGRISIATGGKSLRYTPARGFGGTEFFTYTAVDSAGNRTTARVTLHTLPGDRLDDTVLIQLIATDLFGNPITAIEQGRDFKIRVIVDDLRTNPGISAGVFSAYFDLLYNLQLVTLKPDNSGGRFNFVVEFLNSYVNFTTGDASIPGVINDFGATFEGLDMQRPDPVALAEITFTARSAGIASFMPDPSEGTNLDTLLFNVPGSVVPVERIRFVGTQLEIFGDGIEFPLAVDDSVPGSVPLNAIRFPIDVLANDRRGSTGNISIVSFTNPLRGNVEIQNRGGNPSDQILVYTPNTNFTGFEQFTYTIRDSRGITSRATVSLRVGTPNLADLIADFDLVVTDLSGQPIDQVTVGSQFQVRGFVQDIRPPGTDRGLFNAYMDVLFNSNLVSPVLSSTNDPNLGFVVSFGPIYTQVRDGDVRVPGLINEIGAQASASTPPVGSGKILLFTVTMTANRIGIVDFVADPADISPFHDTLTYIPAQPVPPSQIRYGFDSVRIVSASGGGSGEFHNANMPLDVNNDRHISAIDALLVINELNGRGLNSGGEGETRRNFYPDTSGDNRVNALDALLVINHLNARAGSGQGEGEPEGEAAPELVSAGFARSSSAPIRLADENAGVVHSNSTNVSGNVTASKAKQNIGFAAPVDLLFGQSSEEQDDWDSLLVDLATDVDKQLNTAL